jgi:hypothetical protein
VKGNFLLLVHPAAHAAHSTHAAHAAGHTAARALFFRQIGDITSVVSMRLAPKQRSGALSA